MDDLVEVYTCYVGMSRAVSPYSSFATDLEAKTGRVYDAFISSLSKDFAFSQASTKALRGPNGALLNLHLTHIDYCKRAPIHLLGKPTLLNKQLGGFIASFAPP